MARSERHIPPSEEVLKQMQQARDRAQKLDRDRAKLLRTALKRLRKAELIELTLRVALEEKATEWLLEGEVSLDKPVELLVHDVELAMSIATWVDERQLNYNFDYDWRAYDVVRRGLEQLIEKHAIEEAKELALTLMAKGSYQVGCSDEGLMQEEIESCLKPVISAVGTSTNAGLWAQSMLAYDHTGSICRRELKQLASPNLGGN